MATKKERRQSQIQRKLTYIREQLERYLWKEFKVKHDIKVFLKKKLQNEYLYSRTLFPEVHAPRTTIEVEYDYDLVDKKGNKSLLPFAFREAVRIGMWTHKRPFVNGQPEFEAELKRRGLPAFSSVAETGKELHAYGCLKCKRPYILQEKKLPKSKDPSQNDVRTGCCGELFEYFGKKHYNNETLQKIERMLKLRRGEL